MRNLVNVVLPPRCLITGEIVDEQGMLAPQAWSQVRFLAEPFCDCCGYPFDFAAGAKMRCAACLKAAPSFSRARAALTYDDHSRDMILSFKHGDQTHAVVTFLPWMRRAARELLDGAHAFIPVPLHRWRFLRRRYNQAALLAAFLARDAGIEYLPDSLVRTRQTPSQGHLRAGERRANVRRAFAVPDSRVDKIRGRNLILVDDVYTTGSTVGECAQALLKAGAGRVDVLTLARVVKPEKPG